jgi:hypothetical protein
MAAGRRCRRCRQSLRILISFRSPPGHERDLDRKQPSDTSSADTLRSYADTLSQEGIIKLRYAGVVAACPTGLTTATAQTREGIGASVEAARVRCTVGRGGPILLALILLVLSDASNSPRP